MRRPIWFILAAILWLSAVGTAAQERCFTEDESKKAVASINSVSAPADLKQVRKELLAMANEHMKLNSDILENFAKNSGRVTELNAVSRKHFIRVCEVIQQHGWLDRTTLKDEAFQALLYLLTSTKSVDLQLQMMPLLTAAAQKGDIPKPVVAEVVDMVRLNTGQPQIFGTQATRRGDVLYIQPLLNENRVDQWRDQYGLGPLADDIRSLERQYLLPVLRSQRRSAPAGSKASAAAEMAGLGISDTDSEIKVETKLVNLNVRILAKDNKGPRPTALAKNDFIVSEDGVEQEIAFFSTTENPFDLLLVLDFSGSTADKRSLIKKAAKRFVEVARPEDRIAIVAFATDIRTVSELTSDRSALYTAIDAIKTEGDSPVWDALKFTYDKILKRDSNRRTAIVMMTDALDNASKVTFADVMETVRNSDASLFTVYINTIEADESQRTYMGRLGTKLHQSLVILANESGGQCYKANGLKDLNGIYEQVVNDIGKIYSLGYEPKNENRDGGWRTVDVKLRFQPELSAKTRRGYYAN